MAFLGFVGVVEGRMGMLDQFDMSTGITIIDVSIHILLLLWPVIIPAHQLQRFHPPWVSCYLGVIVLMQNPKSEFVVVGYPD
jgi:hypothetical protein